MVVGHRSSSSPTVATVGRRPRPPYVKKSVIIADSDDGSAIAVSNRVAADSDDIFLPVCFGVLQATTSTK